MTCERTRALLDALDNGEDAPLFVRLHLLLCPSCRREQARIQEAFSLLAIRKEVLPKDLADSVMAMVALEPVRVRPLHQSLRNWLIPGIAIVAYLVLAPITPAKDWFLETFGLNLLLPMSITLGVVLTVYTSIFVASHLDEITEYFHIRS